MQLASDIGLVACAAGGMVALYLIVTRAILPRWKNNTGEQS